MTYSTATTATRFRGTWSTTAGTTAAMAPTSLMMAAMTHSTATTATRFQWTGLTMARTIAVMALTNQMESTSIGILTMAATANGKATTRTGPTRQFGGARILRMMIIGKLGGITVSTMTQTGTALTTSDRVRNSSTLQKETSGQFQTMMATMAPRLPRRPWRR